VAERDASELDVGELRWLKRTFGFYCIELNADPQEVVFAVGGTGVGNTSTASVERYDVTSGTWREVTPMAMVRAEFGLCTLSDGNIYATGGAKSDDVKLASVERYDSRLDTWSAAPSLPRPRCAHCACAVDNVMYILGGIVDEEGGGATVKSVLNFDCRTQTWSKGAPMPEERDRAGACMLGGNIYFFGGNTETDTTTATTYRFSTETNEWATLAPMPVAKCGHSASILDGLIYVIGGSKGSNGNTMSSVHRFDPVRNLWSAVTPICVARAYLGSFVLGGNIYAVGGFGDRKRYSSMERYSVVSNSWSAFLGWNMGKTRSDFGALVVRLEGDLFDSLITRANRKKLCLYYI
jgi:hypothetical protein